MRKALLLLDRVKSKSLWNIKQRKTGLTILCLEGYIPGERKIVDQNSDGETAYRIGCCLITTPIYIKPIWSKKFGKNRSSELKEIQLQVEIA